MKVVMRLNVPAAVSLVCGMLLDAGHEAFMVGGCVRDQVLGLAPNDYDITTSCLPEETMRLFEANGFRVIPVGLKHGTVAVLVDDVPYEITTYRSESAYSDGRHPDEVHFLKDLKGDLERRDFTINAMAYDPVHHELVDYFAGMADVERRVIRAVGDPDKRFSEDYLRMLRAVRYAARFSYAMEIKTFEAVKANAGKVVRISKERVLSELVKMAGETGENFACALGLLKQGGLLTCILPEIDIMDAYAHDPDTHPEGGVWDHTLASLRQNRERDAVLNLAILFHDAGKPLTFSREDGRIHYLSHHQVGSDLLVDIARRLKMSRELKEALQFTAFHHMKFHEILDISNHKLMRLIESPYWATLYRAARCDDGSRGGLMDDGRWRKIDARVNSLRLKYIEQKKLEEIRRVVNGRYVMGIKKIGPEPNLGEYIRRTVEWILNDSININDTGKIEDFIKRL
ncbi:MAG: CCA tRNA nucleotidyltransferase [Candidatus Omnitrophota bacterium]